VHQNTGLSRSVQSQRSTTTDSLDDAGRQAAVEHRHGGAGGSRWLAHAQPEIRQGPFGKRLSESGRDQGRRRSPPPAPGGSTCRHRSGRHRVSTKCLRSIRDGPSRQRATNSWSRPLAWIRSRPTYEHSCRGLAVFAVGCWLVAAPSPSAERCGSRVGTAAGRPCARTARSERASRGRPRLDRGGRSARRGRAGSEREWPATPGRRTAGRSARSGACVTTSHRATTSRSRGARGTSPAGAGRASDPRGCPPGST
jgi:hypothetical protein